MTEDIKTPAPEEQFEDGKTNNAPETTEENVENKAEEQSVAEKAKEAVKKAADKLEDVIDSTSDAIDDAKDKLDDVREKAKDKLKRVAEVVKDAADDVKDAISDGVDNLKDVISDTEEDLHISDEYMQELPSKSLKEILQVFQAIIDKGDQQEMYKYAEGIKAAFYKVLKREKIAIGFLAPTSESIQDHVEDEETREDGVVSNNPFAELERGFKSLYGEYKAKRSAYLQELEQKKDENLAIKLAIIDELKSMLETQEDINRTFPAFRNLQTRWRESGPVPQAKVKDVYDTYQHYVEMFYDYVKINNELRDLDFKKNLEAKIELCEKAEKLIEEENVVVAFNELQKLHEEWKEFGPVDKEHREEIWDRFKLATSQINKKHQSFFEKMKGDQKENLAAKVAICERAEAVAKKDIPDSNGWNQCSKELENMQKEWKQVGFASKKDNQKIYDRFRAACDTFYNRKREYYSQFKDQMTSNMDKKISICEQAEALKDSTDWKKTTDILIGLQKEWKETGPVSRKKSDQVWNRFRAACDYFFENKEKNYGGVDTQYIENLKSKRALIEEVKSFVPSGDRQADGEAMRGFYSKWNEIGFVPFKEKDKIQAEFKAAMDVHFSGSPRNAGGRRAPRESRYVNDVNPNRSEREKLLLKFRKKESEISTYENNIGFFASSKNADALIKELNKKIEEAKLELKEIEDKIKAIDNQFE